MSRNDAEDFAQRLYARIPGNYRSLDQVEGLPLLALLRVIGEQASNLRQDLDALWDNFFIETCEDWAVPYLAALVGANLLAHPVGQSNRLDVRNTVMWRRNKGTPAMLRALAGSISGWPVEMAEFFQSLGWSQNMNHLRLDHPLTADVRHPYPLSLLGRAADPFAHTADFKPARELDQPRVDRPSPVATQAAWGTPGRYQNKNLGFFARRLRVFAVNGATPMAAPPGLPAPADAAAFTFDPLFRDVPLFTTGSAAPLTRAGFQNEPWEFWGKDVCVRRFGIPVASEAQPQPAFSSETQPFTFGSRAAGLTLHVSAGMRLLNAGDFRPGGAHFTIAAEWVSGGSSTVLGILGTLEAGSGSSGFHLGSPAPGTGRLAMTVRTGFAGLPAAGPGRFPGAILAVRAATTGVPRTADALYVYLPPGFVTPTGPLAFHAATDGSTFSSPGLASSTLARSSEGQVYPPRVTTASTIPASGFTALNRQAGGMRLPDPTRFGGLGVLVRADVCTGDFQPLGALATIDQSGSGPTGIPVPNPWPAFTYIPSTAAVANALPAGSTLRLLSLHVTPLSGNFLPAAELIVTNQSGRSLLVYLPEVTGVPAEGIDLFAASDGATYFAPADPVDRLNAVASQSLAGLALARPSAGQVLPLPDIFPLEQRRPIGMNLCRAERGAFLAAGELGVDPELGRFAFAPNDPLIGQTGLTVDYVEAFGDRIGALNFDRQLGSQPAATRVVAQSGDTPIPLPVHTTIAAAIAAAADGDVIEIQDSANYLSPTSVDLSNAAVRRLTVRAAQNQRPCLQFYAASGVPAAASLRVGVPMDSLDLNGLLISGGPLQIDAAVKQFHATAITIDPRASAVGAVIVNDADRDSQAEFLFCRCVTGALRLGVGVSRITLADSIVDGNGAPAIGGSPAADSPAGFVQLERVTVLGRIRCDVLSASESMLNDLVVVEDRQAGCIRFSRYETGSVLPRRFQCVPDEEEARSCRTARCQAPLFASRRWGRPDYLMIAPGGPVALQRASEQGAEVGAFASALNTIRLNNLAIKLREFMPVSLSAVVIAET